MYQQQDPPSNLLRPGETAPPPSHTDFWNGMSYAFGAGITTFLLVLVFSALRTRWRGRRRFS